LPEVAFLGRSNVGKSSVINSLLGMKIAKTSSTPGRTQAINFFEVRWPASRNQKWFSLICRVMAILVCQGISQRMAKFY